MWHDIGRSLGALALSSRGMPAVSRIASPNSQKIPARPAIMKQCYSKDDCNAAVVVVVVIVVVVVVRTVVVVRSIPSAVPRVVSSPADRQGSPGLLSARLCLRAWYPGHYYAEKKKKYIQEHAVQFIARYNIS